MVGEAIPFDDRLREDGFVARLRLSSELEELRQRQYERELTETEAERTRKIKGKIKAGGPETATAIGNTALGEAIS